MLRAARPLLEAASNDRVAYISAASMSGHHLDLHHEQWTGIGSIHDLDVETVTVAEAEVQLRQAALVYVAGGNAFVLAHRLRRAGLLDVLREHLLGGLPYIGVSAGAIICGQDVLLANNINAPGLTEFEGLRLVPFSLNVHYPPDAAGRAERDERISEYGAFHPTPVVAMADTAELRVAGDEVTLVAGSAHLFRPGVPGPAHLTAGHLFAPV